jgi:tetratricopeptide (TPR) repeat protein
MGLRKRPQYFLNRSRPRFALDLELVMTKKASAAVLDSPSIELDLGLGALLSVLVFAAYQPALQGGLLWDDAAHVTKPALRTLHGLWRIWFDLGATQQYYPLLHSAFWFEHRLWGDAVAGYHQVNLGLHVASAFLVVAIMRKLALPGAWLAGFVFALHPVCVESVAWISEQKNTLSTAFYLGSALAYLHFDRERRRSWYFAALGLFGLALLSKSVTATLPAALLVVFWWQRGSLSWRRDVQPLIPWFVLGIAAGWFTSWVERRLGAEGLDFSLNLTQRFLIAGRVVWFYAAKLIWPANLIFVYPRWDVNPAAPWQYLFPLGAIAFMAVLWRLRAWSRAPLAGALFFIGTLFPVLGFLNIYPFLFSYVADHFQYLASLGLIIPLASGFTVVVGRISPASRWLTPMLGGILVVTLGLLTSRQAGTYRDAETLYRTTLARNPQCWMAHNNLGIILTERPDGLGEAISEYKEALKNRPSYAEAHENLGNAYLGMDTPGHLDEAVSEYEAALKIAPGSEQAHNNLGLALSQIPGRLPDALAEYQAALRIKPDFVEAHNNLGNAFLDTDTPGHLEAAASEYETVLKYEPDSVQGHNNLGLVYSKIPGRLPDAISEYEAALRINPEIAMIHHNLGNALLATPGQLPAAISQFEEALRINPDFTDASENLQKARQLLSQSKTTGP